MKLKNERIHLLPGESFRLLRWRDNLHDVEVVAPDGPCHPFEGSGHQWHLHSQMELTLVLQGSGTRFVGDSIMHVTAPDLVLIGPGLPHYWYMPQHTSGYALQFDFPPDHPFWLLPETQGLLPLWKDAQRGVQMTGPATAGIAGLFEDAAHSGGPSRLACLLRILDLIATTAPENRSAVSSATFFPPEQHAIYRSLQTAITFIFHHFHEDLCFADVLRETHMSKATFERQFKRHTGKTFTRFLNEVRLNAAGRQLIETDLTVGEIALASGFNTISHFNHQFRTLHRRPPLAFRRALKPSQGR